MVPDRQVPWVEPTAPLANALTEPALNGVEPFVVTGSTGSGRTRVLEEARRRFESAPTGKRRASTPLTVSPTGGCRTWENLDCGRRDDSHWEDRWRQILLVVDLTILHAHQRNLLSAQQQRLTEVVEQLPSKLFAHPGVKSPFTIAKFFDSALSEFDRFSNQHGWDDVEVLVADTASRVPTYLVQMDNVEEYFDNAPQLMLAVQAGLTRHIMTRRVGYARPAVIQAAVRNTVREHWRRRQAWDVSGRPGYLQIVWTDRSIRAFMRDALQTMSERWSGSKALVDSNEIAVPERGSVEPVEDYILRHTFLTPGDVERMLTYLAIKRSEEDEPLRVDDFRDAVNNQASASAETVIHQVVSDLRALPPGDGEVSPQDALKMQLKSVISDHGREFVSSDELQQIASSWGGPTAPYLLDCLWRHRLLTVRRDSEDVRKCSAETTDQLINAKNFAFHSAILDLCGLSADSGGFRLGYV